MPLLRITSIVTWHVTSTWTNKATGVKHHLTHDLMLLNGTPILGNPFTLTKDPTNTRHTGTGKPKTVSRF